MRLFGEWILYFFVYSFLGWCCEVIYCSDFEKREFVNRGMLSGPICPIYGVGSCVFIALFYGKIDSVFLLFIFGSIVASFIEYVSSVVLERLFNARWWDYSTYPLNINGRVCILNSGLFGILVIFLVGYVHRRVDGIISLFTDNTLFIVCIFLIFIFMYDLIKTILKLRAFNCKLNDVRNLSLELKKYNISLKDRLNGKDNFEFDKRKLDLKRRLNKMKTSFDSERRILKAFPRLKHRKYDQEVKSIRNFFKNKE